MRTVLSGYLARARGVRASPDRIVVCTGFTQGLALLCQVLPGAGHACHMEQPWLFDRFLIEFLSKHRLFPANGDRG